MGLIISNELALVTAKFIIMSNQLTAEQQRKIEENRRKALERRAQRLGQTISSNKQTSVGFNSISVPAQPPKQSINSEPATLAHHGETLSTTSVPKEYVPPFKTDLQGFSYQNQGPKHQQLSGTGIQINNSVLSNSASRKVQIIDPLPQTRGQHGSSSVLSSRGGFGEKSAHPKPNLSSNSPGGTVGLFYKQADKPAQSPVAQFPSHSSALNAVPAKKPAISVRGKCVPHTQDRFRVEVGYHAELIAVFKSIPSKNYG